MSKEFKQLKITDNKEIEKLEKEFLKFDEKINTKVYNSLSEEKLRTIKIGKTKIFKKEFEIVSKEFFKMFAKDLHPKLTINDLEEGAFYKSSGKNGKVPFRITKLSNDELTVSFFHNNQKFVRHIFIKPIRKNMQTKIKYTDISTGMISINGYFEKRIRSVYIKRQSIAFEIECLKVKKILFTLPIDKVNKIDKKIERMLQYSKKLF